MNVTDKINNIYNKSFMDNSLPDKFADLIIADPPYYEVKGDFDFKWKDFDHYLSDVELWAKECKRLLKDNGTLLWYGSSKRIAYTQVIFDKYFDLQSNITLNIINKQTQRISENVCRSFINTCERVLMYSNEKNNSKIVRDHLRGQIQLQLNHLDFKKINTLLESATNGGGLASALLSLNKKENQIPTNEVWDKLSKICKDHPLGNYYDYVRYFKPSKDKKKDVISIDQEGHIQGLYNHPTVKPEKITSYLINSTTLEGYNVLVPFVGSGTECAMSVKYGRNYVGYEIDENYYKIALNRITNHTKQGRLF